MDIYAKPGTKVKYTGEGGYNADKEKASALIEVGTVLTVKSIDVHSWISYVEFEELPTVRFNTVMFEEVETKPTLMDTLAELSQKMQAGAEKWDRECDEYWDKLSYDDKLKAFHSVCKRIHEGDVKDQGSYRHVLYSVFGFEPDAYIVGMECGYMDLHNYIQDGVSAHRDYVEKDKNEHL